MTSFSTQLENQRNMKTLSVGLGNIFHTRSNYNLFFFFYFLTKRQKMCSKFGFYFSRSFLSSAMEYRARLQVLLFN